MASITILDPTGEVEVGPVELAPGVDGLAGHRIGVLFNNKQNRGEKLLSSIATLLTEAGATVVSVSKASRARPAETEVLEQLAAEAEAVVSGVAD